MNTSTGVESIQPKITFWQGFIVAVISIGTTILVIGLTLGGTFARIASLENQAQKTESIIKENQNAHQQNIEKINIKLDLIKENAIKKEDFDELRRDVKELGKRR